MPVSTFTAVQNVYVASAYPDQNFGKPSPGNTLYVGTYVGGTSDIYRSLLQFNIWEPNQGIPSNSTIESAELLLSLYRDDNRGIAQVSAFRLDNVFDQQTVTYNTKPLSIPPEFGPVIPTNINSTVRINITSLVQGWYDGSIPNCGIELKGLENANNNILAFFSTRTPYSFAWPALQIKWSKGTLSETIFETLTGAPKSSTVINMAGQEQATWLVVNTTDGNLAGSIRISQQGGISTTDPNSNFTIPAGESRVIYFTGAATTVNLIFTAAGTGDYLVSVQTRDE
ncbi:MAG: DNRLRE domain-containing protein [Syntrophomonadaceae bacterium]